MAQKDLHHRITGDSSSLERASDRGSASMSRMAREARRLEREQEKLHRSMETVGRGMLIAGAAIAAGLALSVKAAIDWESAWAGVLKTVDGTPEQMAALEEEIRSLTAVLPASHREIAAVAEAAGQLGVQREDVAAFTKTMIDMGEATNLSSDEAATALARFMNIMQTAPENVVRLASAIVDLGNKGATTESEITEMALRIAGAGRTIGLSEQQVLGFAAALSNVGIRAEAGGTAISKVFLEIDTAVAAGGDNLETFAETAGMTAAEFRQAYEQDAGGAIAAFVGGLARVQESGGDVNAILSELGLTEIRVSDALRRLAGSGRNLTTALDLSNTAWDENTALVEEAERRYGTVEARMGIARNQVNDFAITVGQTFLPVVGNMVDTVGVLAEMIGGLPGPVKTALAVVAGLSAAILLAGGAALVAVPKIHAFNTALDRMAKSAGVAGTAARGLRGVLAAVPWGPLGLALTGAVVAITAYGVAQANARAKVQGLSDTLDEQNGAVTENTRLWIANELANREATGMFTLSGRQLGDFTDNLDKANVSMKVAVDAVTGDAEAMARLNEQLEQAKQREDDLSGGIALSTSERGKARSEAKSQRRAIEEIIEVVQSEAGELEKATELRRLLAEGTGEVVDETEKVAPASEAMATALSLTSDEADSLTSEVESLDQALKALLDITFGVEEAQDATAQAMRRVVEAAEENGTKLKGNSEAALTNRENVRSLIAADFDLINAMAKAGASADDLTTETEKLKQKFIDQMVQAGFSEEAVERYAEAYDLIPSEVEARVSTPGMTQAERQARQLRDRLAQIDRTVTISFKTEGFAPVGGIRIPGAQHGGEIPGPSSAPVDSRLIAATPGEIMIRRSVAQENRAALLALNATGRWPVSGGGGRAGAGGGGLVQNIEAVNVTSIGSQFRTKQIFDDLALHGAS